MCAKAYFTVDERYHNLVEKKLIPEDINRVSEDLEYSKIRNFLRATNYFKLKPYIKDIEKEMKNDKSKNYQFEDIVELYKIDRKLRASLIKLIEIVEIGIKTFLIEFLYENIGENKVIVDYLKLENFKVEKKQNEDDIRAYKSFIYNLNKKIGKITDDAKEELDKWEKNKITPYVFTCEELNEIKMYFEDGYTILPFWIVVEQLSFGDITTILKYLSKDDMKCIFKNIGNIKYSYNDMSKALNGIRYIRNLCSHNSRLCNQSIKYSMPQTNNAKLKQNIGLLRYLVFIKLFVHKYDEKSWNDFREELKSILESHKAMKLQYLHLPMEYMDYL